METQLLLQHLIIEEQCFSVQELNQMLAEFELHVGYMECTNRPSPITRDDITSTTEHSLCRSG